MRAVFHPEADLEFQQAIEIHLAESMALGLRFYRAVMDAAARIETHPKAWPRVRGDVRKCLVAEFPYQLLYTIEPERIQIVAVMHGKREPSYWAGRTK